MQNLVVTTTTKGKKKEQSSRPKGSSVITESRSRPPPPTQDELQVLLVLVARRKERCAESGWESTGTSRQARNACRRRRRADPWAVLCRAGPAGPAEAIMQSRCGLECQDENLCWTSALIVIFSTTLLDKNLTPPSLRLHPSLHRVKVHWCRLVDRSRASTRGIGPTQ
jgi:hypothetical protein